jgi:glycosyltransferase involved in cell wall biosynthesis
MVINAVHQFHPGCSSGDGITNGMFFTRRLLRELGFKSEIYCQHIPAELAAEIQPLAQLSLGPDQLLLVHHSLGYDDSAWLDRIDTPKVLVYHNITPENLLPEAGELRRLSVLGRKQLLQWAPRYLGAIGVSESNSAELREAGYANIVTMPLLVDLDRMRRHARQLSSPAAFRDCLNLLFVGRICENKRQLDLVEMLHELRHFADQPVRLILAGGVSSEAYRQRIAARIAELDLSGHVMLAGKVSDATLVAMYRHADAFVCMSEHEGFGMPLVEAMCFDVPVVAHAASSIPDTVGEGGLLSQDGSPRAMAALTHMLLSEPALRRRVIGGQRRNLERFAPQRLREQLAAYLAQLGLPLTVGAPPLAVSPTRYWQVEGPFDSNYSLAIVNRQCARALAARGNAVGLRSMEGGGDFIADAAFLRANPDCALMARRAAEADALPDVSLRFCYPPHVDGMLGKIRAVHSYGWEETEFPAEYVAAFNRKLDLITVLSTFVEQTLRNNGVRIPIVVTGGGVDQLQSVSGQAPAMSLRAFRFLHISSCFPRKGVDALLAAYGKAFRDSDDVSLIIKTFPNPHNDVAEQIARLRQQDPAFPHVVLIDRDSGQAELVGLYQASHAFVAPSRGEGLGLPLAEAMLYNLPVITTAWGGQTDFCKPATAWLCDYRFVKTSSHLGTGHSVWADPDVDHLARLLREVHGLNPEQRQARTAAARLAILKDYTWDRVAQRTEEAIRLLEAQPVLRNEPKIGWISTWNTRCGIATYSSFLSVAIPQDRLTILANRADERTAADGDNVVRCWNAHFDESLDLAYDTIVARGLDAVIIQYNFGFFTLATLGRLIERLKAAGIGVHCFFHSTADLNRGGQLISLGSITSSLKLADRLYVHAVEDMNRLRAYGLADNLVFFPHGVMPPLSASDTDTRIALGLQGKRVIASYGFLLPHKGIQQLIGAFGSLAKDNPSLHLLLINALYPDVVSSRERDACVALIKKMGLTQRVTLMTDFLPDEKCLTFLGAADLVVYPYQQTQESASGAVRIGLACGKPVAVTPLPIFDDVYDAVLTLPGTDEAALARGIGQLIEDRDLLNQQTAKAARWAESRRWPLLSTRLLNLIDGIANPLG